MSLKTWADNSWIRSHKTSEQEIQNLLAIVERDLKDARVSQTSADWRFGIAYNAVLKLCTILLYSSGYRPERNLAHYRTLQALPLVLGKEHEGDADYLDACRTKRNTAEYDYVDVVSDDDVQEIIHYAEELKEKVLAWLKSMDKNGDEEANR